MLGALEAEAASDPELGAALREQVVLPRRAELARRLVRDLGRNVVPIDAVVGELAGSIRERARRLDDAIDDEQLDVIVSHLLGVEPRTVEEASRTS